MKKRILKRRFLLSAVAGLMMGLGIVGTTDAETTVPHFFTSGSTANAVDVNENFQSLADAIDNVPAGHQGPVGPQGTQGLTGGPGPHGPTGSDGATGPQGPPGLQGPSGNTGATGPQGLQGVQGDIGPQGLQGIQGPAGVAGTHGTNGSDGMTGPAGPQGAKGLHWVGTWNLLTDYVVDDVVTHLGSSYIAIADNTSQSPPNAAFWNILAKNGDIGATGPQGLTGTAGLQGTPGRPGLNGMNGATGPQGLHGIQGPAGVAGTNGSDGMTGPAGPQGVKGLHWVGAWNLLTDYVVDDAVTHLGSSYIAIADNTSQSPPNAAFWNVLAVKGGIGADGPQGPTGLPGLNALNGATGPQGPQGPQGSDGLNGLNGVAGATGLQGPKGVKGDIGVTGAKGDTGIQGPAGTSQWTDGVGQITTTDIVGIGTESPAAQLHVGGTPGVDGIMFPDGTLQTTASSGNTISGSVYRWNVFSTYSQANAAWYGNNDPNIFGGITPSVWTDGNGIAANMSADKEILRTIFSRKGFGGKNAVVFADEWMYFSSTNGKVAMALFRIKNTTANPITWTVTTYLTSYFSWGERASIALNGVDIFTSGVSDRFPSTPPVVVNLSIPAGRTSTAIFVSTSSRPLNTRSIFLAFTNNSLQLPAGLEYVDDLDVATGGWNQ